MDDGLWPWELPDKDKRTALIVSVNQSIDEWSQSHFHQVRGLDKRGDRELVAALDIIFKNFVDDAEGI